MTLAVQGSTLSPLLGNVYLHHVLDLWLEQDVRPRLRGRMEVIRYADDFVIGFERADDARRVKAVLGQRFERFGLKLHPDKTRLFPFARPRGRDGGGADRATFDFLGFTVYWRTSYRGDWALGMKTRKARLLRSLRALSDWCRRYRHEPLAGQHATLTRKLAGHYNYFAVSGNGRSVAALNRHVHRIWHKWLNRRSQRTRMTWERFGRLLEAYPLPAHTVRVNLWA